MAALEAKDLIAITISGAAAFLSFVAFIVSYRRGEKEKQRAVRDQITAALDKITENMLENAKLQNDPSANFNYIQAAGSVLNQRNSFLLKQAVYLSEILPKLMTYIDYNTIGWAASMSGELTIAETNYQKAIHACPNDMLRALATRSYGNFLFMQRRFEEGREQFLKSASLIRGADNFARHTKGFTYQNWGWCELHNANSPKRAEEAFESARSEFSGIDNEAFRQNALAGLEAAKQAPLPFGSPDPRTFRSPPGGGAPAHPSTVEIRERD
jgi:tetratricopeptide (TPR) repeat protein